MTMWNAVSFAGIFLMLGIAWLFSADRRRMNVRVLLWGFLLQLVLAGFIFWVPAGAKVFLVINDAVIKILDSAFAGIRFMFGRLALSPGTVAENGESSLGFFFAFQALPTIVFFAALVSILYFFKVMPFLIRVFARVFTRLMRISGAESLCAASNIFVGVESVLTVRPYLDRMTCSELHTVLTAGMATIASSVLAMYVLFLRDFFPTIAGHLVSASLLSAPAALVMSKILLPETGSPETLGLDVKPDYSKDNNVIEAAINGANAGLKLVAGIAALLLAFLGLIALADLLLGGIGGPINSLFGIQFEWSLKNLLGYLFYPLTLAIGVPPEDARIIAGLIGERALVTELTAYQDLAVLLKQGAIHHARSSVLCTYALCGFAHVASLAVFIGGITAVAPGRARDLSRIGPRALLAATLASLMTAAVAGTFYTGQSLLLN
ncbi:nucleoside transporter [bacterium]|nr:nucleoside transporter [bacterium]